MHVPSLTVDMLAAVIALAQKKNLEPAGEELGLSPSAVHKRIKAANQIFGTRLFVGTNDGFELTEIGRTSYSHATLPIDKCFWRKKRPEPRAWDTCRLFILICTV